MFTSHPPKQRKKEKRKLDTALLDRKKAELMNWKPPSCQSLVVSQNLQSSFRALLLALIEDLRKNARHPTLAGASANQ